jgi:hypothetical protein
MKLISYAPPQRVQAFLECNFIVEYAENVVGFEEYQTAAIIPKYGAKECQTFGLICFTRGSAHAISNQGAGSSKLCDVVHAQLRRPIIISQNQNHIKTE